MSIKNTLLGLRQNVTLLIEQYDLCKLLLVIVGDQHTVRLGNDLEDTIIGRLNIIRGTSPCFALAH